MSRMDQLHSFLFDRLLMFQSGDLIAPYSDEMRLVFGMNLSALGGKARLKYFPCGGR